MPLRGTDLSLRRSQEPATRRRRSARRDAPAVETPAPIERPNGILWVRIALGQSTIRPPGGWMVLGFKLLWAVTMVLAWAALYSFGRRANPDVLSNRGVFFWLLYQALVVTCIPLVYWLHRRLLVSKLYRSNLGHCTRQGILLATFIVFNLYLSTVRSWSWSYALLAAAAFGLLELLALTRR
jgi:hypothetical protein